MAAKRLNEGETKKTDLPMGATMIERMVHGKHFIDIVVKGVTKSSVVVNNYTHWEIAFDAAMDKAGL